MTRRVYPFVEINDNHFYYLVEVTLIRMTFGWTKGRLYESKKNGSGVSTKG